MLLLRTYIVLSGNRGRMVARNGWMWNTCGWIDVEAMDWRLLAQLVHHRHLQKVLHHELVGLVHLKLLHIQFA